MVRAALVASLAAGLGLVAVLAPVGAPAGDGPAASPTTVDGTVTTTTTAASATTTTAAPPTTGALPTVPPAPPPRPAPGPVDTDDPELAALTRAFLTDPRIAGREVGLWVSPVEGGDGVAVAPDRPLLPASVQKLATAMAVFERIEPTFAFETAVTATALPGADGVVRGDLAIVGGGDPTLTSAGPHSLDALAAQVRAVGVRRVDGVLRVDTSRWADDVGAPGWLGWQQPAYIGWLSALLVDENRWQAGPDAAQPGLANAPLFLDALGRHGVTVSGGLSAAAAPAGTFRLAARYSAPRDTLVREMLLASDNLIAEAFLRELGVRLEGVGTHLGGVAVVDDVLRSLEPGSVPALGSATGDGSGLSRENRRSAGEWGALLRAARERASWWPSLQLGLPTAGATGTLASRFGGTAAAGVVHAKTGTTVPARSLAGVFVARSGTPVIFAVVVNGTDTDPPVGAEGAIDHLVAGLVTAM
jgi:D-alanyl-D-alanine carboxypeptidase/D-alanyl-D-alanine-endopeptidase (penicillin-binding protein 4)